MKGPSSLPVLGQDSRAGALRSTDLIGRSLPTLLLGFALGCLATYWYTGGSCTGGSATAEAGPGAGLLQKSPRAALGEGEGRPLPPGEAAGVPDCVTPAFPVEGPNSDWYSLKVSHWCTAAAPPPPALNQAALEFTLFCRGGRHAAPWTHCTGEGGILRRAERSQPWSGGEGRDPHTPCHSTGPLCSFLLLPSLLSSCSGGFPLLT